MDIRIPKLAGDVHVKEVETSPRRRDGVAVLLRLFLKCNFCIALLRYFSAHPIVVSSAQDMWCNTQKMILCKDVVPFVDIISAGAVVLHCLRV